MKIVQRLHLAGKRDPARAAVPAISRPQRQDSFLEGVFPSSAAFLNKIEHLDV